MEFFMKRMPQGGIGSMGNMNALLKQAQKMQEEAQKAQEEIAQKEFEISAGGGVVTVTMLGTKEIKSVKISPEIVDLGDIETLEDILIAAFNEAGSAVDKFTSERMTSITGGMNIPGL